MLLPVAALRMLTLKSVTIRIEKCSTLKESGWDICYPIEDLGYFDCHGGWGHGGDSSS